MPRFERFADVLDLEEAALRQLVEGEGQGDAPERVWAAWALALRGGTDAGALFGSAVTHEPSAGVRAHLALMLVAHGERSAAMTLARRDPEPLVRATASRCLARTAAPEDDVLNEALALAARDPSPEVRAAVLDGLRTDAPPFLIQRVLERLDDGELDVRTAAVDFLLRRDAEGTSVSASLREHALREPSDALFAAIVGAWIASEGLASVVRAMSSWSTRSIVRALDYCLEMRPPVAVADLELLLARDEPAIDKRLAAFDAKHYVNIPLRWLLLFALRVVRHPATDKWTEDVGSRWTAGGYACQRLSGLLETISASELGEEERLLALELAVAIDRDARDQCAAASVDVDVFTRYLRGEATEAESLALLDDESFDDELPSVFGLELLPSLHRLTRPHLHGA